MSTCQTIDPLSHLRENIDAQHDRWAVVGNGAPVSYRELAARATRIASGLRQAGLQPQDRFAVRLANGVDFAACYLAAISGGFTIVPINHSLPQHDIDYILQISKPQLTITSDDAIPEGSVTEFGDGAQLDGTLAIFFTSGTTNRPKGVCQSVRGMLANARAFNELTDADSDMRMLHVMPMGYMAGFLNTVLCPLMAGGTIVLAPPFEASAAGGFWQPVMEHQVNTMWITPTIAALLGRLNRSEDVPRWTAEHLRRVFVGTAPLLASVKDTFEKTFHVECLESYGMTEVMLVSVNTPQASRKPASVGRLLPHVAIETRDGEGRAFSAGCEGPLYVQSEFALQGYLDPETSLPVSPLADGWLATGDLGRVDDEHDLFITGRIKDLIIHGGANVSPRAVEEVLLQSGHVQEAAVVGEPHPFWGEEVVAYVIMKPGASLDSASLKTLCKSYLSPDAVPARFIARETFPRASTGKIQRHQLKESP